MSDDDYNDGDDGDYYDGNDDGYGNDDDVMDFGEGGEFQSGFDDKMRSMEEDACDTGFTIVDSNDYDNANNIFSRIENPVEKLKKMVGNAYNRMIKNDILKGLLSKEERNTICKSIDSVLNPEYMNATAYILGFTLATYEKRARKSIKEYLNTIGEYIKQNRFDDSSVKLPDVFRYYRFFIINDHILTS